MNNVSRIIDRIESLEMAQCGRRGFANKGDLVEMDIVITVYTGEFSDSDPLFVALKAKGFSQSKRNGWEVWESGDIQFRIIYS